MAEHRSSEKCDFFSTMQFWGNVCLPRKFTLNRFKQTRPIPPPLGCACRRGERPFGPSRIRPCGLTAASHPGPRFARLASTSLLGRSAGLRSGLFCAAKRSRRFIRLPRPVGPFACSGRANLPSIHTHMSAEAYPPDGPQISPRQGSQNFSARAVHMAWGGPVRERGPVSGAARGKLLRPASRRLRRP
jgi:hypothetical protein